MKTLTAAAITLCAIATASLADDRETSCRYQGEVAAAVQKARLDGVSEAGVADAIAATNPGWPAQYNNAIPQLTAYVYQLKKRDLRKIDLVFDITPGLTIYADPQRVSQAITNLLLNAIKFSDAGARIVLRGLSPSSDRIQIEVVDQGIGIPEDELEGIFDTYKQGRAGREAGGSGLGLMIARRLVELHGGTLSAESQVGVGSRFTLSLPKNG